MSKSILKFVGMFLFFLLIFKVCDETSEKYPIIYYYSNSLGSATYTLNKDGTCKISKDINSTVLKGRHNYDVSWHYNGGYYVIKTERGTSEIIRDGYLYLSWDAADAKRDGIKLTRRE